MALSAKDAAEQVGMSKAGIIKAIRTGKLSGTKNQNGEWEIDASELFRVYKPVSKSESAPVSTNTGAEVDASTQNEIDRLRHENDLLRLENQLLREWLNDRKLLTTQLATEQPRPVGGFWARLFGRRQTDYDK